MSENAAAERHAHTEWEDPPCTKDLTQGIEDINNRIVGCKDPCTSTEAPAKGTSAKCTETTPVVLESAPHETQNEPQDSPQVTPRLPIEAKPSECEREVAESVVMAERTNGKAQLANPPEMVADVNEGTPLGRELVVEACGVDEGDREHNDESQLQCHDRDIRSPGTLLSDRVHAFAICL